MSYDVSIGDASLNYTSNVAALFYDHIPASESRGGLHELHGKTGKQAVAILDEAWSRIHNTMLDLWRSNLANGDPVVGEPEFCAKYDAPNGWGSAVGALVFFGQLTAACATNPRKKVRVWA